ncbi:hypothetical protein A7982_13852 [Minicystis rosea]|nr:hypothetical protein A7982_13852 [Minicystis rosea]
MSRFGQEEKTINLTVTVDEANLILEGVGQLPFARVYGLITKVQQQASQQLGGKPAGEEPDAT